jgi:hypothetical protein
MLPFLSCSGLGTAQTRGKKKERAQRLTSLVEIPRRDLGHRLTDSDTESLHMRSMRSMRGGIYFPQSGALAEAYVVVTRDLGHTLTQSHYICVLCFYAFYAWWFIYILYFP